MIFQTASLLPIKHFCSFFFNTCSLVTQPRLDLCLNNHQVCDSQLTNAANWHCEANTTRLCSSVSIVNKSHKSLYSLRGVRICFQHLVHSETPPGCTADRTAARFLYTLLFFTSLFVQSIMCANLFVLFGLWLQTPIEYFQHLINMMHSCKLNYITVY